MIPLYYIMPVFCILWVIRGRILRGPMILAITALLGLILGFKWGLWIGLLTFITSQSIHIGYGNFSPQDDDRPSWLAVLTKDRGGFIIRAIWGLIVSVAICLPVAILKERYDLFLWYVPLNVLINYSVSRLKFPSLITDILVPVGISSIILL